MALWVPFLKASLPIITHIVTAAVPAFTSKPKEELKVDPVVARQIEELQTAVTHNAESIQVLAVKFQETIEGLDGAAVVLQKEIARLKFLLYVSCTTAMLAVVLCGVLFVR